MDNQNDNWDMYCEKCGYRFKHSGMRNVPWKKVGLYKCPECNHDVQIARNPKNNIVIGFGRMEF